jgi:putative ABC transport system permease protein
MRTVLLRNLWAHKRRLVATATAVVLGVAFLCGTLVVGDTTRAGFDSAFRDANAGIDAVVRSSDRIGVEMARQVGLVDRALVEDIGALDVVAAAAPSIEASAQLLDEDGDPVGSFGPPTLGGNWVPVPGLNPYRLAEGRAPEAEGEVVIDRASSESAGLAIGDRTAVLTPARVEVTVVGLATFGDHSNLGGTTFTAFTTDQAARVLLGDEGAATSIAVEAADGTTPDELVGALEPLLPEGAEALTGTELSEEATREIPAY